MADPQIVAGALIGGGSILLMGVVGTLLFRKEAMGFGDVKLSAAIGLMTVLSLIVLFGFGGGGPSAVDTLLNGVMFVDGVFFVLTGAAVFVLRRAARRRDSESGAVDQVSYRVPLYPVVPAIFVIGMLGILVGSYLDVSVRVAVYTGGGCILVGALMYACFFRDPPRNGPAHTPPAA